MKTTKAIIGAVCLFMSYSAYTQDAQVDLLVETEVNDETTLKKPEKEKLFLLFKKFSQSLEDTYSSTFINSPFAINDIKEKSQKIKTNNGYLFIFDQYSKPKIKNDSIYIYQNSYNDDTEKNEDDLDYTFSITSLNILNTAESWNYENSKFIKTVKGISLAKNEMNFNTCAYTKIISSVSKKGELLVKNKNYDYLFPEGENEENSTGFTNYEKEALLTPIISDILQEKIKVYDENNNIIDEETLKYLFANKTTIKDKTIYMLFKMNDIIGINFTEDWYLASNQFDIIKEVKSITFLVNEYNNKREIIGTKKLPCIIKFDN